MCARVCVSICCNTDHGQQSVDDGEFEQRYGEDEVVGGGERLEQEDGDTVASVALQHDQRQRVAEQAEHAQRTCGVRRMNEVNARRARLVPGWVTVFGRVYHLGV